MVHGRVSDELIGGSSFSVGSEGRGFSLTSEVRVNVFSTRISMGGKRSPGKRTPLEDSGSLARGAPGSELEGLGTSGGAQVRGGFW